ncbi:hypothetical protein PRUPE_1G241100 [Prunus persica]|uniref:ABC transporter domain-containing protein n=1 Tax=Prunus persica TaxID=3760 RepID=M5XRR3_PRUPE|nr:hypothetical protein PRUPE_1G241100 [Prunus persica]
MAKKGGIFRYADGVDKLLLVLGTLGSTGDGLMTPLMMLVLSRVINEYGGGFAEGICWTGTAERQASRMRMEYFKSVLRQEVAFFDKQANSSMIFKVISTISSDAHLIHDTITEKQGFSKGLLIGSMGRIYAAWAFQAWVGCKLVTGEGEKAYVKGDIKFRDVDFCYPSRSDSPVLQGLNLKVQAELSTAMVEIPDGLVNQELILFATSIKENILFGKEGAPMEHLLSASKVGQFGVQLSEGQKQRISIARAIIRNPEILLLDEATSALDAQSEKMVQEALNQASQGRTTIVIAHRLTTICEADLIAVLQSGRVIEIRSHDELVL